jgi:hypothetical protein
MNRVRLFQTGATLCLGLLFVCGRVRSDETFESLAVGTNIFKNVRVIQASPVDLLLGHEEGFKRVKLQELPDVLKAKYPYDEQKAAAYEKERAKERQAIRAQNTASARASLLAREAQLRAKIETLQKELKRINADIGVQDRIKQGKATKSRDRQAADALRRKKLEVRDQIWRTQDELEKTEALRRKYE